METRAFTHCCPAQASEQQCHPVAWPPAVMLMVAVYGSPPYGFFLALKWVVVGACGLNAWQLFTEKPVYIAVAWLLVASGAVQAFAKMSREDWPPFNWATAVLLAISGIAMLLSTGKARSQGLVDGE